MAIKGSDEELPIYGGRECPGGWFQFLFRENFGHYHEQFSKKKVSKMLSKTLLDLQYV